MERSNRMVKSPLRHHVSSQPSTLLFIENDDNDDPDPQLTVTLTENTKEKKKEKVCFFFIHEK